jgi:hypothetical protein
VDDNNPYESTQNTSQAIRARGNRLATALMALGFVLVGISLYIFFCAESWTFYTPYSIESSEWLLHLPNGSDFSINSYVGVSIMIGCVVLGSLLIMISTLLMLFSFRMQSKRIDS